MITNNSVSEMNRLMQILDGKSNGAVKSEPDGKISAMKTILESFYDVSNNAIKSGNQFADIKEAYQTEETPTGVKIGNWYIDCVKEDA